MTAHAATESAPAVARAIDHFVRQASAAKARRGAAHARHDAENARKSAALAPVREMLWRLISLGVVVHESGDTGPWRTRPHHEGVPLDVYEYHSSPSWSPGISLFLDHPAQMEIAIPNRRQENELGVVVIRCATHHPDAPLVHQSFRTMDDACAALSQFLVRNTIRVERLAPAGENDVIEKAAMASQANP